MTAQQRTRRRKRGGEGLGRTQRLVLMTLAESERSVRDLAYDWPMLTQASIYSAIEGLGRRGLVDAGAGDWSRGRFSRTFVLTAKGREVERTVSADPLDTEG